MKKLLQISMILLGVIIVSPTNAQRYITEYFDEYQVTQNVSFGVNVQPLISTFPATLAEQQQWQTEMDTLNNLILWAAVNNPDTISSPVYLKWFVPNGYMGLGLDSTMVKITPLTMDIYTPPAADDVTNRPVFVYIHTGNFLPPIYNGGVTGDKGDSTSVNICKQMAKRGYVAVSINYRLGWNPLSDNENTRKGTLLQAVFRAIIDTQTAVRYLKVTELALGNPYGIDPDKINLFGQGSGGYVAVAYATLNDYITEVASLPKFINTDTGFPFIIEAIDGTLDGGPGFVRLIDPLQGLATKDICMTANIGGALADSSWLNAGEPPMVAFQTVRDPFAPFDHGMVIVPTTNEDVVEVDGANIFIQRANNLGNNDAFADIPDGDDVYTDAARATYGVNYDVYGGDITVSPSPEGLYPFLLPLGTDPLGFDNQGSPWDWADETTFLNVCQGSGFPLATCQGVWSNFLFSSPDMSAEQGLAYIDTIQGYLHPRVVLACNLVTGIAENPVVQSAMDIFPNPSSYSSVTIRNEKAQMSEIVIMDAIGKVVLRTNVNAFEYRLNHEGWKSGMYFVTILFEEGGQMTKKLVIK
jgi:hypothetical protein